jgi:hypothetical protein
MMEFDLVKKLFKYQDGELYWLKKCNKKHGIDNPAGTINSNGYRIITFNGKKMNAHRLIWLWHGKELPIIIDHINGNLLDNRIENLRAANVASNGWNSKIKSDNTSGVRGVSWCNTYKKWIVQLFKNNKKLTARFKDFDEACQFATAKRKELHGEFFTERLV